MPDRDVYDRNVERKWQTAARHVHEGDDDAVMLRSLIRALGQMLKEGGCPGIDGIASIVGSAGLSLQDRRDANVRLNDVRRASGSARTEIAIEAARRVLVDPGTLSAILADGQDRGEAELAVATVIIVELGMAKISCAALIHELTEREHKAPGLMRARREHARELLLDSPHVADLARAVLANPEGRRVTVPRMKTPKMSQEDILHMAISA